MRKRVALYVRGSGGAASPDLQRQELEAVATRSRWNIVARFADSDSLDGSGGTSGFDALQAAMARREFDLVALWSIDIVPGSLSDLVTALGDVYRSGCNLYLHKQALDTSTAAGSALFRLTGVFVEFEALRLLEKRPATELRRSQIPRVREREKKSRPARRISPATRAIILALKKEGLSVKTIAIQCKVTTQSVREILEKQIKG